MFAVKVYLIPMLLQAVMQLVHSFQLASFPYISTGVQLIHMFARYQHLQIP